MTKPRLRFAPSPTGYLHIGGVRTALFNWLWARKTGGTFVLRIEDTDRERSTVANEDVILRELRWLGLEWDEGPTKGGAYGPYRQLERLELYREFSEKLVASGAAYRCYATKEELEQAREALRLSDPKAQFRYPGWWRDKGPTDWLSDRPYVIRLRTPKSGHTGWNDLVFGEQRVPNDTIQDVVLVRSDGVPLYNFGCAVDDLTMGITLVGRGRDHMINTPIQLLIYEALGSAPPQFGHLPMMLGKGGEKLSKRHGAVSVGEYREQGVPPLGLLNYLVRFGWSFGDQEVFTMPDLVDKFDWSRTSRADGKFDSLKLSAIAFEHMKGAEFIDDEAYVSALRSALSRYGNIDERKLHAVLPTIRPRAKTFVEAAESVDWLFSDAPNYDEKAKEKFLLGEKAAPLGPLLQLLVDQPSFVAAELELAVKTWAEANGYGLGDVAQPARVALTGRTFSPGLFDIMELLGREITLARLDAAVRLRG